MGRSPTGVFQQNWSVSRQSRFGSYQPEAVSPARKRCDWTEAVTKRARRDAIEARVGNESRK